MDQDVLRGKMLLGLLSPAPRARTAAAAARGFERKVRAHVSAARDAPAPAAHDSLVARRATKARALVDGRKRVHERAGCKICKDVPHVSVAAVAGLRAASYLYRPSRVCAGRDAWPLRVSVTACTRAAGRLYLRRWAAQVSHHMRRHHPYHPVQPAASGRRYPTDPRRRPSAAPPAPPPLWIPGPACAPPARGDEGRADAPRRACGSPPPWHGGRAEPDDRPRCEHQEVWNECLACRPKLDNIMRQWRAIERTMGVRR